MASIKLGGGIIDIRGSVAGNVYSRNRYGNYMRAKTMPINPNTDRQQIVRAAIAFLTAFWSQTLTAVERTAWNLYADSVNMANRLGETIQLSGFNHFIRSNTINKQTTLPIIAPGPTVFELPAQDPTFAVTGSEATQQISVVFDDTMDWDDETDARMFVFMGKPQNAQINFFGGPWRNMGTITGVNGAPTASPQAMTSPFVITEGQHFWAYARIMRIDGRISQPFRDDSFCAA